MTNNFRLALESKTRAELNGIAKKLRISGYTRPNKSELIDHILEVDSPKLKRILFPTWWDRYHNHLYGTASIVGVLLAILFFFFPNGSSQPNDKPTVSNKPIASIGKLPSFASGVGESFSLNTNWKRRDEILGIDVKWDSEPGGTVLLDKIDLPTLEQLFRERFIDPSERQNDEDAPSAQELLFFIQKHPETMAHGYAVSPSRSDYRITIDGLSVQPSFATKELKLAFMEFCKDADELEVENRLWAWWD